ncbi:hypothetical protein B566_EDAN008424 [Ephemera danica]|nr:hypothetical protein B566_EDAN008424 [Ephemera danica]
MEKDHRIAVSPTARDPSEIPTHISLTEYLLQNLRTHSMRFGDRPWVVDVLTRTSVLLKDVEEHSRRMASALTRLGFKARDVLFFVTYEGAQIFLLQLAVWRLGGVTRGWHAFDLKDEYRNQIQDCRAKFVLVDEETAPLLQETVTEQEWDVTLLSFGDVKGATKVKDLLEDDGSAMPENLEINPRKDVVVIASTGGSTGKPKGVFHTHYSIVSSLHSRRTFFNDEMSLLSPMVNFWVGSLILNTSALCQGGTTIHITKFDKEKFFDYVDTYKPEGLIFYPYLASWLANCPKLKRANLDFLKTIMIGSWVLDADTVRTFNHYLPQVSIVQMYGMTEALIISSSEFSPNHDKKCLTVTENEGHTFTSSGRMFPYVKIKVVDPENSACILERGERGEIMINSPSNMLGYMQKDGTPNRSIFEADGYMHTGDLGFLDEEGNIYIIERLSFVFKYKAMPVSGSISKRDYLVGIPNPDTDTLARAFVVLRAGYHVTADELQAHVANRLNIYKHLHGGVRFVDSLPVNRNGKLERRKLKEIALQMD